MGPGVASVVVVAVVLAAWAAFWGALAANVGMSRGAPTRTGAVWGLVLGPFGLAVVLARTRGGGRSLDERVASGREVAGRYGAKAKQTLDERRRPGPTELRPSAPPHVHVPPPTWGPPAVPPAPPSPPSTTGQQQPF